MYPTPTLQKDLNLIRHLLVNETYDVNVIFTPSLTKKQKKLNIAAYNTRFNGETMGG